MKTVLIILATISLIIIILAMIGYKVNKKKEEIKEQVNTDLKDAKERVSKNKNAYKATKKRGYSKTPRIGKGYGKNR